MNFETYLKIFENSIPLGRVDLFNVPIEIEEKERNNLYAAFVVALEKEQHMKPHYFYGVDVYGNVHAFKSKGYRNELVDMNMIESLPAKGIDTYMACTYNRYMLVHDTNDFDTYRLVRYK